MSSARTGGLEVIRRQPPEKISPSSTALLFLHGAYAAAWCWDERFLPYFAAQGYESLALRACEEIVASGPQRGAAGAQPPECTLRYMRMASTARTPIRPAQ